MTDPRRGTAIATSLVVLGGTLLSTAAPAGAAGPPAGTAPVVRAGSLDVVGWDDALVGEASPRLSWTIDDADRDERQTAYQVEVSDHAGTVVWDSGPVEDERSTLRQYGGPDLDSGSDYSWRVRTWDASGLGSDWSAPAAMHIGLLDVEDWHNSWISVHTTDRARAEADLDTADVDRAYLYFAAVGDIQVRLNGQPVSDEQLGTTWTDWDQRVLYRGVDVTDLLVDGENAVALTVGATLSAPSPDISVMAQLEVVDGEGERHVALASGDGWRTGAGPVTRLDTYLGESYDARLEAPGWDEGGFDDNGWAPAPVVSAVVGTPLLSAGASVTARDTIDCCGWSRSALTDGILVSTDASQGYHSATTTDPNEQKWVQVDLGASRAIGSVTLHGAKPTNDPAGSNAGAGFPVRYRIEASDDPTFATSTLVVDRTGADQANPGITPVVVPADVTGRYVRVTATKLSLNSDNYSFRLAELVVRGTSDERAYALSPLEADPTPYMRAAASIAPVSERTVGAGIRQVDFGQNYAGWVQLSANAPAGTTATIYVGEILDDNGRVSTSNLNFAPGEQQRQTYRYTFSGNGQETWQPMFAFSGFRYAELSGLPAGTEVTLRARPVHTDLVRQGSLDLADPLLTRIDSAVRQSQLNAMHGLPEDTPTREKKGWAGDALSGVSSILTTFDSDDLYRKYLRDLQTSIFDDGGVASVAPSRQFGREFKVDPAWGAAYPGIAWEHYLQEGDASVFEQHYADLQGWLGYLAGIADADHIIVNPEVSYGEDWQATVSTPRQLFHTLYYLKDTRIIADIARVLGHDDDAAEYDALATEIAAGVNRRFLDTDTASYSTGTQFANAFPLLLGIVPSQLEDRVLARLVGDIQQRGDHLTTGFVGTQLVIQALHLYGRDDVILDTALREDYPSLGYMLANGPGTIWEKWVRSSASDGTSSKDHPALGGGMEEWFYRGLAGITPLEAGYRRISLKVPDLPSQTHAAATQETPLGTVSSSWRRDGADLDFAVEVPVGATAEVVVPAESAGQVTENGAPLADVAGVHEVRVADGSVTVTVGSGSYDFAVSGDALDVARLLDQVQSLRAHVANLADDGQVGAADAAHLDGGLADTAADLKDALLAVARDDASAAPLGSALQRVQALREWLPTSSIGSDVRPDLDGRLATVETALSRAVISALGVRVSVPPIASPALPGTTVTGAVDIAHEGTAALTGLTGTLAVAGWTPDEVSVATVPAGGSVSLPVAIPVPGNADPASYDAALTLRLTVGDTTYSATETIPAWATVTSGLTIGAVTASSGNGDPIERLTLAVPVTNTGSGAVRAHALATLPDGWRSVPSAEVRVAAGATVTMTVPVAVPLDRVGGTDAIGVEVQRGAATLATRPATVSPALLTPPGAASDHVDWGKPASESAHSLLASAGSGTNVEAGVDRRYSTTTPGASFSAVLAVPAGQPFLLRSIETFDADRTKRYDVYVDGTRVRRQVVPRAETGPGTKTYDLLVDDPALLANGGDVRVRFEYPADAGQAFDASLADTWAIPVPADTMAPDVAGLVATGAVGDNGWYRSDVTVDMTAIDSRDPEPAVELSTGDSWTPYAGATTLAGDGEHEVAYRARDAAGNVSEVGRTTVPIDATAPQTVLRATRGAGVENADTATLSFTATDATSGVAVTAYRVDDGPWHTVGAAPVTITGFGEHRVDLASTDVAGNTEPVRTETVDLADVEVVAALVAPQVRGTARIGTTLTATPGSWNTKGLTFGYQWLRNGAPIAGARAASYRVVAGDVGRRISVRVTATKAGRAPGTATSASTAVVPKTASTSTVKVARAKVRAGTKVTVTATVLVGAGVTATGKVAIVIDGRTVRTVALRGGKASVRWKVTRGQHRVTVRYQGSARVAASTSSARSVRGV